MDILHSLNMAEMQHYCNERFYILRFFAFFSSAVIRTVKKLRFALKKYNRTIYHEKVIVTSDEGILSKLVHTSNGAVDKKFYRFKYHLFTIPFLQAHITKNAVCFDRKHSKN